MLDHLFLEDKYLDLKKKNYKRIFAEQPPEL